MSKTEPHHLLCLGKWYYCPTKVSEPKTWVFLKANINSFKLGPSCLLSVSEIHPLPLLWVKTTCALSPVLRSLPPKWRAFLHSYPRPNECPCCDQGEPPEPHTGGRRSPCRRAPLPSHSEANSWTRWTGFRRPRTAPRLSWASITFHATLPLPGLGTRGSLGHTVPSPKVLAKMPLLPESPLQISKWDEGPHSPNTLPVLCSRPPASPQRATTYATREHTQWPSGCINEWVGEQTSKEKVKTKNFKKQRVDGAGWTFVLSGF